MVPLVEQREQIAEAKRKAKESLLEIDGIQGVGVGDGRIRIYVRDRSVVPAVPHEIEGIPVEVVLVGDVAGR